MKRYGMVIDLSRCIGCQACAVACAVHHGLPKDVRWSKVKEKSSGSFPFPKVEFLPLLCMQCANPSCLEVCPTGATYRDEGGIVRVNYDRCMGCGYCTLACPYDARVMVESISSNHQNNPLTEFENKAFAGHRKGVVEKCDFCFDRVSNGEEPACVGTCPTNARIFGDINDPNSKISKTIASNPVEQIFSMLGNDPSVYYVGR